MKITKLMLSALVAAAALVSCNKEDLTPEGAGLKTVKISLENIVMTKGAAGNKINAGDLVQVNDLKIFLTDNAMQADYEAHDVDGNRISTHFSSLSSIPEAFHFISNHCTKVVVVANCGDVTFDQVKQMQAVEVGTQQNQTDLILVGNAVMSRVQDNPSTTDIDESIHTNASGKYTEVYQASVTLSPIISRFEIDGFAIRFSAVPNYNEITIQDVAFQDFYRTAHYTSGGFAPVNNDIHEPIADLDNNANVFGWFNNSANTGWYRDSFTGVTLTPSSNVKVIDSKRAYHFFAGTSIVPTMIIKVLADGQPSYVYTDSYAISTGGYLDYLRPGMIYRMYTSIDSNGNGDGVIEIPDDFDPIQRCINVSVSVEPWVVTLIAPEF